MAATVENSNEVPEAPEVKSLTGRDLISQEAKHEIKAALSWAVSIQDVKINSQKEFEGADALRSDLKAMEKTIKEYYDTEVKQRYYKQYQDASSAFKPAVDAIKNALRKIDSAFGAYYAEQRRKEQEEQRRLDAIAEEERRKREEQAERERLKAEAYREQGKDKLAEKADARAEDKLMEASVISSPTVERITSQTKNTNMREKPICVVTDMSKLLSAISGNPVLFCCVEIKTNELAKFWSKNKALQIPGCEFKTEYVPVSKRS